jgi:hypothetical protein
MCSITSYILISNGGGGRVPDGTPGQAMVSTVVMRYRANLTIHDTRTRRITFLTPKRESDTKRLRVEGWARKSRAIRMTIETVYGAFDSMRCWITDEGYLSWRCRGLGSWCKVVLVSTTNSPAVVGTEIFQNPPNLSLIFGGSDYIRSRHMRLVKRTSLRDGREKSKKEHRRSRRCWKGSEKGREEKE